MKAGRDLDLVVIEKVMGWKYDRARTFAPSSNLINAWEMEEYLLGDENLRQAYGEALAEELKEETEGASPADLALIYAHASLGARCRAALKAVGASETELTVSCAS